MANWYSGPVGEMRGPRSDALVTVGKAAKTLFPGIGRSLEKLGQGMRLEPSDYVQSGVEGALLAAPIKPVFRQAALARRPMVENALYPKMPWRPQYPAGSTELPWAERNVFSPAELENMQQTGYMLPSPKMQQAGRGTKFLTLTDQPKGHLRIPSNKVPVGRAIRTRDVEILNKASGQYEPFTKADLKALGYLGG